MQEQWRQVVGYETTYLVSSTGRIQSLPRLCIYSDGRVRVTKQCVLTPWAKKCGHLNVALAPEKKKAGVHTLVLRAFVGECPDGMECLHADGDPANNNLGNLRWGTRSENMADRTLHGTSNRGERHGLSKLTKDQVRQIRADTGSNNDVASRFSINEATVRGIRGRTSWAWLE